MDNYKKILNLGCFTRNELANLVGNEKTADSIIYQQQRAGNLLKVRRNLYVALDPSTNEPLWNSYEISSKINGNCWVSHHSALELHGLANQVFNDIYVSSQKRFSKFIYDNKEYQFVYSKFDDGVVHMGNNRVSNLERTMLDCINDIDKSGGLEELMKSFDLISYCETTKLLKYLNSFNSKFLWQKCGYLLSHFTNLKLDKDFFDECKKHLPKTKNKLQYGDTNNKYVYNNVWNLYVPYDIESLYEQRI